MRGRQKRLPAVPPRITRVDVENYAETVPICKTGASEECGNSVRKRQQNAHLCRGYVRGQLIMKVIRASDRGPPSRWNVRLIVVTLLRRLSLFSILTFATAAVESYDEEKKKNRYTYDRAQETVTVICAPPLPCDFNLNRDGAARPCPVGRHLKVSQSCH